MNEIHTTITQLLQQLESPFLSYGDFQQKAEIIKRGLDMMIVEKAEQITRELEGFRKISV